MPTEIKSLTELDDAISSAQCLFLPGSSGEPCPFLEYLAQNVTLTESKRIVTGHVSGLNTSMAGKRHESAEVVRFFPDPKDSQASDTLLRCSYFDMDAHIRRLAPDIAVTVVTPPDRHNVCAPAVAADFTDASLSQASVRIALVNPRAPRLMHAPQLPLDQFTHVMSAPFSLLAQPEVHGDDISRAIARIIAGYVVDGSTLQTGIGKIPAAVLEQLEGRKNLRLHSGILTKEVQILSDAGMLARDGAVCAPCYIGNEAFYHWLHQNDHVDLRPVSFTHAPETLAGLGNFVAINSAIEVDLAGQVNAEWAGPRQISAPGGMPNFAKAAAANPQGYSIVGLPATDRTGARSRIVPRLDRSRPATLSAESVDIVVTEYGVAALQDIGPVQRAKALIAIAHPDHRERLLSAMDRFA